MGNRRGGALGIVVRRALALLLWAVVWPGPPAHGQAPAPGVKVGRDEQSFRLGNMLLRNGYAEVPLTLGKTGLLEVTVRFNGTPLVFLVDTGANDTIIDRTVAQRLNLPLEKSKRILGGIGGTTPPVPMAVVQEFAIGAVHGRLEGFLSDLSHVNGARQQRGDPPCAGLIGGNVLRPCDAVIDYSSMKMYLRSPAQK